MLKILLFFHLILLSHIILCEVEVGNGKIVNPFEYPHIVSVYTYRGKQVHYCAGGLINSYTVLLAAHCFDNIRDPKKLYVQAATNDVSSQKNGIIVHVKDAILHPQWDPKLYVEGKLVNDYDIALVFLENNITENGVSIRYMNVDDRIDLEVGSMVDVAGWGYYKDKSTKRDYKLRKITVPIQPPESCKDCKDEIMICAGDGVGKDACHGDSGTPLVRIANPTDRRWTCSGICSFGPNGCGRTGSFGVYTRVAKFHDWVWENTEKPPHPPSSMAPILEIEEKNVTCYGVRMLETNVCNGNGACISDNRCSCYERWEGLKCEDQVKIEEPPDREAESIFKKELYIPILMTICFACLLASCFTVTIIALCCDVAIKNRRKTVAMNQEFFQLWDSDEEGMTDDLIEEEFEKENEEVKVVVEKEIENDKSKISSTENVISFENTMTNQDPIKTKSRVEVEKNNFNIYYSLQ